jgi:hypothetical protein
MSSGKERSSSGREPSAFRGSRHPQGKFDLIDLGLDAFEVLGVDLEDQVLGAEQENCLEDQLKPLALPVLKGAGKEILEIAAPFERLAVRLLCAGVFGELCDEVPRPRSREQQNKYVDSSPSP